MGTNQFRIKIDGSWTAREMGDLFSSCSTIYHQFAQYHSSELNRKINQQQVQPQPTGNEDGRDTLLKVKQVSFASPGWADLLGAGELVGHLKEFLLGLIDRITERRDRDQARQLKDTEIEAAILENYGKQLDLLSKAFDVSNRNDLSEPMRQSILNSIMTASRPLGKAIAERRIISVENLSDGDQ